MNRIVCFTKSEPFRSAVANLRGFTAAVFDNTADLAKRIVEETELLCLVVHMPSWDPYWERFFSSLKLSFPLLNVLVVQAEPGGRDVPFPVVTGAPGTPELKEKVTAFLESLRTKEKRRHQRFDWPLVGAWTVKGQEERSFRVRSISSSGAFLESESFYPAAGTMATLRIQFLDFQLLTGCQALERRAPTSVLPAGFGVRFTDLSDASRKVVDSIIADELIMSLTEPDKPLKPPSIQ